MCPVKKSVVVLVMVSMVTRLSAQVKEAHLTVAGGNSQGTVSLLAGYNWDLGAKKKFAIGFGTRFTSFFGSNQYYLTAPAELTTGSTGPLVIFNEDIPENMDSVLIGSPQVNSFNAFINLRYAVSAKFQVGFNIDAIGFSFGAEQSGRYINGSETSVTTAKPTGFNVLLISDNDRGSLNSEFFGQYSVNEKWAVKVAGQFHFTEYTTETEVQQFPEANDRFRNKSLLFAIGVVRRW